MIENPREKKIWLRLCQRKPIDKNDIRILICEYDVDEEDGHHGRWTTSVMTIIKFNGHYYRIDWQRGNTEYQENEYEAQILEEVEKRTCMKEVTKWVTKS